MIKKSLWGVLVLVLASTSLAQDRGEAVSFTLESAVAAALAHNPAASAARSEAQAARFDINKAYARGYLPRFEVGLQSGLVPEARGDIFDSPDQQTDLDGLGPFYKFNLNVIQPLLTFGQAGSAVSAARHNLGVEESKRDLFLEDFSLEVIKAYWGVSSALKAENLARQAGESYDELLTEIQKRLQREDSEVDDEDFLEAKSHGLEIELIKQESIEKKASAVLLFNFLLDRDSEAQVSLSDEDFPLFTHDDAMFTIMIRLAERLRSDLRGLEIAREALEERIKLEKKRRLPLIYLALNFSYAWAGNREDQTNPFAVDGFNYRNLGGYLGLRWEPEFFLRRAEIRQLEIDSRTIGERVEALRAATALEVSKAYAEVRRDDALLKSARNSLRAATSWLRLSHENWDMGLGDAFRLLRAYQSYFELRTAEIEREYEFNVSLAKLSHVIGDMDLYMKWVKSGRVALD